MSDDKWDQLVERLQNQYPELERFREPIMEAGVERGRREIVEFDGPVGPMQVVRESRPQVEGKKFHYSNRQGDTARTEYVYSETELTHTVRIYKDADGEWEEIDAGSLSV